MATALMIFGCIGITTYVVTTIVALVEHVQTLHSLKKQM